MSVKIKLKEAKRLIINGGQNLSAKQIIDIISKVDGSQRGYAVAYFFEHKSFSQRHYQTKRAVARHFHSYSGVSGSWLCEFGLPDDVGYIRSIIAFPYEENRQNYDIEKVALNRSLTKNAVSEFLSIPIFLSEESLLAFFQNVPEEKLDTFIIYKIINENPEGYTVLRDRLLQKLRSHVESEETLPKDLPDEWILKIANFKA